ncbi:MAG: LysE family translocator [Chloroflexota bacterium]
MSQAQLILFMITSFAIIISPGQDMFLVMSRSLSQGPKAGVAISAGVATGLVGHTILATLGLGALLMASETLFSVLKFVGAAYLVYLGVQSIRTKPDSETLPNSDVTTPASTHYTPFKLFMQGVISNLSNPKIAIFYIAYLPQFVPIGYTQPTVMLFTLGVMFALLTFLIKGVIGVGAGSLSTWLRTRPVVQLWINRVSGVMLIGLGVRLAFEERG